MAGLDYVMDVFLKVSDLKRESRSDRTTDNLTAIESMFRKVLVTSICVCLIIGLGLALRAEPDLPATTPERPWVHRYDRTLTIKMMLALKDANGGTNILLNLDQALEVIKKIDSLTVGIPKIVYVVGWQYDGHDSKYPAFFAVNAGLKRPQDATALDSLKWFMQAANQYHTTVSVHINLRDAYKNSPLWQTYVDHDLLQRGADGQLIKGSVWGGDQSYMVCYTQEWNAGYTQKRIDELLNLLPLEKAGTIHIDAFHTSPCPAQGISREQETITQRKIYRYFRDHNMDVTSEFAGDFRIDPLVGLQPMAWWFKETLREYLERPASLYTGGVGTSDDHSKISLEGQLFGTSMHGEDIIERDPQNLSGFLKEFCLQTVPWYYLNQHQRLRVELMPQLSKAFFAGNVITSVDGNGRIVITEAGRELRDGDDILMPAGWIASRSLIAYSANGSQAKSWELPPDWKGVRKIKVEEITLSGLQPLQPLAVVDGRVLLTLQPNHAELLTPAE
jgi:hypothetical protein